MAERPALLLLPGLLCADWVWAGPAADLADVADITVADFFGFDSITAMAESVLAKAPARFAVAGHSMGGRVALEIVRLAPERVRGLALLNSGVHPRRPNEAEQRQVLVDLAHAEGMDALARRWLPPMVAPARTADVPFMERLAAEVRRATPDIFERQIRALLNRPDAEAVLPTIACPTLVLGGHQDGWSPADQQRSIAAGIAGASLTLIDDCGHMSPVEQPEAVGAALRGWLHTLTA